MKAALRNIEFGENEKDKMKWDNFSKIINFDDIKEEFKKEVIERKGIENLLINYENAKLGNITLKNTKKEPTIHYFINELESFRCKNQYIHRGND